MAAVAVFASEGDGAAAAFECACFKPNRGSLERKTRQMVKERLNQEMEGLQ
jgi:hypothetical protein